MGVLIEDYPVPFFGHGVHDGELCFPGPVGDPGTISSQELWQGLMYEIIDRGRFDLIQYPWAEVTDRVPVPPCSQCLPGLGRQDAAPLERIDVDGTCS